MNVFQKLQRLADLGKHHVGLKDLPDAIFVPALGGRDAKTVAIDAATVDDLALALVGLRARIDTADQQLDQLLDLTSDPQRVADTLGVDHNLVSGVLSLMKDMIKDKMRAIDSDIDAVKALYDHARAVGALGADVAVDALLAAANN